MENIIIMPLYQSLRRIKGKGFTYDFNLHEEDIIRVNQIVHIYRYEGNSNPDDEAVVYGIIQNLVKMCFVTGFAANSVSDAAQV
jgi:hypothetical protein